MTDVDQIKVVSVGQTSMASELERAGYRKMGIFVTNKNSFQDAFKYIQADNAEVLVISADDPSLNYEESIRFLKSDEKTKEIPIILTSVQSSQSIKKKAMKAGVDIYLELPIPRTYFVEQIKMVLSKQVRNNNRIEFDASVSLFFDKQELKATVGDVSTDGMSILTDVSFPEDKEVDLKLRLPVSDKPIILGGVIVRSGKRTNDDGQEESFVAVKFTKYQSNAKQLLAKFVRKYHHDSELKYYL